jgi:hypothetical protein
MGSSDDLVFSAPDSIMLHLSQEFDVTDLFLLLQSRENAFENFRFNKPQSIFVALAHTGLLKLMHTQQHGNLCYYFFVLSFVDQELIRQHLLKAELLLQQMDNLSHCL